MKKIIVILALLLSVCVCFTGCKEEMLELEISALEETMSQLKSEVSDLTAERDALKDEIVDIKVENGTAKYVVTFNISQSHFTLDLSQHFKDAMNDITIQIPVDKEYYDSVEVGDTINDDFRMGSFIFAGSFGNWDITVEDKCIQ